MASDDFRKSLVNEYNEIIKKKSVNEMINDMRMNKYSISYTIDVKPDPNDPQETEEMAEKIAKELERKYSLSGNNQITPPPKKVEEVEKINYSNIEDYFNEYLDYKINIEKRSISSKKAYVSSFYYLKFLSTPDTVYNFAFFKQFQKNLMLIPSNLNKFKKFEKLKIDEIEKVYKKEQYETLANKTINNHLNNIINFFDYIVYNEIIEVNHVKKVKKLEEEDSEKVAYSETDLIKIFSDVEFEQELKEFCKVAIYTGCRIGEIANIKKADVDLKEKIININGTKTKNAIRIMPINPNILEIIEDKLQSDKSEFLFFEDNNTDCKKRFKSDTNVGLIRTVVSVLIGQ